MGMSIFQQMEKLTKLFHSVITSGNFVGGKQEGIFKVLSNTGGSRAPKFYAYYWEYKNGSLVMDKKDKIKSIKNEKLIPDYLKKIK